MTLPTCTGPAQPTEILIHDAPTTHIPTTWSSRPRGGFVRGGPDYKDWDAVGNPASYPAPIAVYTSLRPASDPRQDRPLLPACSDSQRPPHSSSRWRTLAELQQEGLIRQHRPIESHRRPSFEQRKTNSRHRRQSHRALQRSEFRIGARVARRGRACSASPFSMAPPLPLPRDHN